MHTDILIQETDLRRILPTAGNKAMSEGTEAVPSSAADDLAGIFNHARATVHLTLAKHLASALPSAAPVDVMQDDCLLLPAIE